MKDEIFAQLGNSDAGACSLAMPCLSPNVQATQAGKRAEDGH
jgi:hypothetical protein